MSPAEHVCSLPPSRRWVHRVLLGPRPLGTTWSCHGCRTIWCWTGEGWREHRILTGIEAPIAVIVPQVKSTLPPGRVWHVASAWMVDADYGGMVRTRCGQRFATRSADERDAPARLDDGGAA